MFGYVSGVITMPQQLVLLSVQTLKLSWPLPIPEHCPLCFPMETSELIDK